MDLSVWHDGKLKNFHRSSSVVNINGTYFPLHHFLCFCKYSMQGYHQAAKMKNKKDSFLHFIVRNCLFLSGGVGGIRTPAPVARSNDLANRPLQPLEYHSISVTYSRYYISRNLSSFCCFLMKSAGNT